MHRFYRCFMMVSYGLMGIFLLAGCDGHADTFSLSEQGAEQTEDAGQETSGDRTEWPVDLSEETEETEETEATQICVYVCGQVQAPGVYYLDAGSRICDAVSAAGGCLDTADICAVNQAERLVDGSRIYIPQEGETAVSISTGDIPQVDGLVHLNRADKETLMTLPGIGETKADAILEYRDSHGGFTKKEELMDIPGIKDGVFRKIEDYITVE
mgnify:CR=1 FL=1